MQKVENRKKHDTKFKIIIYIYYLMEDLLQGYIEKVKSQCFAFENMGFKIYLYISKTDKCILYEINKGKIIEVFSQKYKFPVINSMQINKNIFKVIKKKLQSYLRIKEYFECLFSIDLFKDSKIIYIRRHIPIMNILIKFLKKLKENDKIIVYEYPTYPWENELIKDKLYFYYVLDKLYYKKLISLVDYIPVIMLGQQEKLSDKFITISNGIRIKNIPKRKKCFYNNKELHMIGLANVAYWHGYDRIIKGIINYYDNFNGKSEVYFHIVGNCNNTRGLKFLVKKNKLEKHILFHGYKVGKDLNDLFNLCHIGVGSIGLHRQKLFLSSSLKNREYCARGIPFVISNKDMDFPEKFPYIKRVPANESAIDIDEVINFFLNIKTNFPNYSSDMRSYAEKKLSWEIKLKPVVDALNAELQKKN